VVALTLDAADESDARAQAAALGYNVLAVRARRAWLKWSARRARFPLILFSQELLALLEAGLNVVDAVETLAEKETRAEARKTLRQIIADLYEGRTLSSALQRFPEDFPPLYVATVRASERTGDLGEAMRRYIAYQTQIDLVRKKVVSASIYPLLLVGAGGLVTVFLMVYVVPRFSRVYEDIGTHLPWMSRLLLEWGKLLQAHGAAVLVVLTGALGALAYLAGRPATRSWVQRRLWRVPAFGERMRIYQLARFYRTLGMLLSGGIPIVQAMSMVADLLPPALRGALEAAADKIREGRTISFSLESHRLATPVASRMLRVGEHTGRMGEMMERIAAFHDDEMSRWVEWFTRLFEPLLMACIGVLIGLIVVLMYMPIFELAGSLQ
jgi:general secretion pathway protein F